MGGQCVVAEPELPQPQLMQQLQRLPEEIYAAGAFVVLLSLLSCWQLRRGRPLRAMLITVLTACAVHGGLAVGWLSIPRPPEAEPRHKVLGIGLSRTGTTSLTVALREAGIDAYHASPKLVDFAPGGEYHLNEEWMHRYQAHTDIQAALVFRQIAEKLPSALFVYTHREPRAWARSMHAFVSSHAALWTAVQDLHDVGAPLQPVGTLFSAVYGGGWQAYGVEDWLQAYLRHDAAVAEYFGSHPCRYVNISITAGEGWERLGPFLAPALRATPGTSGTGPLPRADVFEVSFRQQPVWQLANLGQWVRRRFSGA
eukprot:TRINITY_DN26595_c0_g1_i1.p2 TRINITY_DN26595_c0_g1~~TRINITY_DN26595_c0_g1_i1.p2  ORF type:complete len:312 (+),score=79.29 TRINITY_DN26595_c0_g1_i1:79-1014(+)